MYEVKRVDPQDEDLKARLNEELQAGLRQIDREELEALGVDPAEGVRSSVYESDQVYYGRNLDNGRLAVVFGIDAYERDQGTPPVNIIWCLGTDEIKNVRKTFVKESAKVLQKWVKQYGMLMNTVGLWNKDSLNWLKWLGAEFAEPREINGKMFVDFFLRDKGE